MYVYVDENSIKPQVSSKVSYYPHLRDSRIGRGMACASLSLSALLYLLLKWDIAAMVILFVTGLIMFAYLCDFLSNGSSYHTAKAPEIYTAPMQKKLAEAIAGKIDSDGEAFIPHKLAREIKSIEKAYAKKRHLRNEHQYKEALNESRRESRLNYESKRQAILQRTSSDTQA